MSELLIVPVDASSDSPSGNGGTLELVLTEKVYGGVPPLATIVQPAYAAPCVPLGHEVVSIANGPPGAVTVTFAVDVVKPAALVAVSV
jgi:hypothetical protein